jgi:hypothetical protein
MTFSVFDWISIAYSVLSLDTIWRLGKNWQSFWDDEITALDRFLIQRTAVFVLIPIGVFFHELGHAIATWQVGGTVAEFQWRVFWGYVVPSGYFSAVDYWWIALSGNIVSIVIGLLALPPILFIKKQVVKELLYSFAIVELGYSLLFYPLFSFTGFEGDWVRIYDFSVTPYAQITLVVHLSLIAGLWYVTSQNILKPFLLADPNAQQESPRSPHSVTATPMNKNAIPTDTPNDEE